MFKPRSSSRSKGRFQGQVKENMILTNKARNAIPPQCNTFFFHGILTEKYVHVL